MPVSDHANAQLLQRVGAATDASGAMVQLVTGSINTIATKYQVIPLAVLGAIRCCVSHEPKLCMEGPCEGC